MKKNLALSNHLVTENGLPLCFLAYYTDSQIVTETFATPSLSVKTIESHRKHIKQKLLLQNGIELVHRAIEWAQCQGGIVGTDENAALEESAVAG